ncbi:uncharacterized protein EI90DRAFT_3134163 [Cantharellus anzutake]|uniref:uncharacterized protein n=1 Tax=Cantharellus anzutake TaxID=1750568 RepID=UPI00190338BB|nr:uncharacterized protein EI90DRAFT_3134163 [Cantharellus anzutake]KAF8316925.1 hypothetical protein EI90DRAFT_3134163 [Cantharellus anzutake]
MSTSPSLPSDCMISRHHQGTADDGTDTDEALSGDISTTKNIEAAIKKPVALYALLHSPFLSKKSIKRNLVVISILGQLRKHFHLKKISINFVSTKILELRYPILTKELHMDSGAIPWLAKAQVKGSSLFTLNLKSNHKLHTA